MTTNNESSDKSHEERLRALVESTNPKLLVSVLKGELLAAWMARSAALPVTDAMVDRFLAWRLPKDFAPDGGISFKPINHPSNPWPVGTNVFTADQARQMLEYVLEGSSPPTDAERDSNAIMLRALLNILAPRQREGETAPAALVRLLAPPIPSPERSGAPRAWMNAEGLISSACGGGYDTPLYDRKALSEALAPAVKTQAEADAVSELIDTVAPSSEVTGTPRTDAEEFDAGDRMAYATMSPGLCVPADFARQLERELAEAKQRAGWLEEMAANNNRQYEKQLAEVNRLRSAKPSLTKDELQQLIDYHDHNASGAESMDMLEPMRWHDERRGWFKAMLDDLNAVDSTTKE